MVNSYDKGDVVRVSGTFTDSTGAELNPTAVMFRFRDPENTETTYTYGTDAELVRDSSGVYHVDVDADLAGKYYYRMFSTGTGKASGEGQFLVKQSEVS